MECYKGRLGTRGDGRSRTNKGLLQTRVLSREKTDPRHNEVTSYQRGRMRSGSFSLVYF